jgi:hypothetical protein
VKWTVCAKLPGTYRIVARASAQDAAGHHAISYSQAQSLTVTKGSGKC